MIGVLCFAVLLLMGCVQATTFVNPIRDFGPDPFIVWDNVTSAYYFMTTSGNDLKITTAPTIAGLKTATQQQVFTNSRMQTEGEVWAPELHKLDGSWYIYYSLKSQPWVIKGGANPLDPYTIPIKLAETYGIDGTVLTVKGVNYFVWSCLLATQWRAETQSLCIAKLITPTRFDPASTAVISIPDQTWERVDRPLNEAPAALQWAGQTYLTYSASPCWTAEYSLALLHLTGEDPLKPASWTKKTSGPVFTSANGWYGTGHNGLFVSPDGTELWNVFHAVTNPKGSCGNDRKTFVQKVNTATFLESGPVFGQIEVPGGSVAGPKGEGLVSPSAYSLPVATGSAASTIRTVVPRAQVTRGCPEIGAPDCVQKRSFGRNRPA